ncbi:hypothetical protein AVEN_274174-1 [Araneus ventricosus]|uniref:Uncharacterized protein n=1 Tax=Araneus ventricosus TaxID=182803 RepID=A0A4Y2NFP1_ARAVE|nr:hypothetical protein AVEN_274174-1 [Araneus ventricosus]
MSQRSDLLKWRRNRAAAQRQISEEEKNEKKERAKRYYEKSKQKKNSITNYFQINEGASTSGVNQGASTSIALELLQSHNLRVTKSYFSYIILE